MAESEVVVAEDPHAGPLLAVKGILLKSSLEELRALGHYDRYVDLAGAPLVEQLERYLGGEWVPVEAMRAHYRACDGLSLSAAQLTELGARVGGRLQSRLLSTLTSAARTTGFDPWSGVSPLYRMAGRVFQGSTARIVKLGPKEMENTVYGNPLCEFLYFRVAYCGTVRGMFSLLGARSVHVKIARLSLPRQEISLRVSWV